MSNYTEKQKQWVELFNVNKGDKVTIITSCKSYENGWDYIWDGYLMNEFIGKTCLIQDIRPNGIIISDGKRSFLFPYFVLFFDSFSPKIEPKIEFSLNDALKAVYEKGEENIIVNNQYTVSISNIKELINKINNI